MKAEKQNHMNLYNNLHKHKACVVFGKENVVSNLKSKPQRKTIGLTSAISYDEPNESEIKINQELLKTLDTFNLTETSNESNHRIEILAKLNTLVKQWIRDVSISKNIPPQIAENLGGKIFTFGSYRLGVHHKGADIDALCVAPASIQRFEFFKTFFDILKKQPGITEIRKIEEAFVPVIKMKFDGIEIDLLFARLNLNQITKNFRLKDADILKNLDAASIRSLNGCRVTDEILNLVPNVENFKLVLIAIKLWAKRKSIYSNSLGYFGGVTWAMLVARTCQLYPNAAAGTIINKFFKIFARWQWPLPVLLKRPEDIDLGLDVWDPRINVTDRLHLMPIITPAYPQQNSTFNVTESTRNIIINSLKRGFLITDEIMLGRATWDHFFEWSSFFSKYKVFIILLISSNNTKDHLEWCGLVESKIRLLVGQLERNSAISLAHANPKCFDLEQHKIVLNHIYNSNRDNPKNPTDKLHPSLCSMWFVGFEIHNSQNLYLNLTQDIQNFTTLVTNHANKINMLKEGMNIEVRPVKRRHLNQYLDADILKSDKQSFENENKFNTTLIGATKNFSSELKMQSQLKREPESDNNSNVIKKMKREQ